MNDSALMQKIEGLLFASGKPLSRPDLTKTLGCDSEALKRAIHLLASQTDRGVVVVDDGSYLELRIAPVAAEIVEELRREDNSREIGRAGLEVLAAIVYRGPLSRADIDFIRGVNSSQTLRTLTMRGLVRRIPNPKDERSFRYEATTDLFAALGATHARDLPEFEAVREKIKKLEESYREAQANSES